jgi:hypothetical protein
MICEVFALLDLLILVKTLGFVEGANVIVFKILKFKFTTFYIHSNMTILTIGYYLLFGCWENLRFMLCSQSVGCQNLKYYLILFRCSLNWKLLLFIKFIDMCDWKDYWSWNKAWRVYYMNGNKLLHVHGVILFHIDYFILCLIIIFIESYL